MIDRYIYILEAKGRYAPHPAARRVHVAIVPCHEAKACDVEPVWEFGLRLKGAARPDDTTCCEVFVYISIFVNCGLS